MSLLAFCDDFNEYEWFISLTPELRDAQFRRIGPRGQNPLAVESLIAYDRPDVILLSQDGGGLEPPGNGPTADSGGPERPVLVLEKTREVPTGHNVGQRMARLVRSVEHGVPAIYFCPFRARKHGKHTGICNLNARLLGAFEEIWRIHNTPLVAINWPADEYGELYSDHRMDSELSSLLEAYIRSGFDPGCDAMSRTRSVQHNTFIQRCEIRPSYSSAPPSITIQQTLRALKQFNIDIGSHAGQALNRVAESVIYKIEMTEAHCRREDPYTGMQFIYDYLYCRYGPKPEDKCRNLLLHFPKVSKSTFMHQNPNDLSRKSSNWYLTASALFFSDGWLHLR